MRFLIPIALMLTLLSAQNREALLIGNSDYKYITDLQNPKTSIQKLVPNHP